MMSKKKSLIERESARASVLSQEIGPRCVCNVMVVNERNISMTIDDVKADIMFVYDVFTAPPKAHLL